MLLISVLLHRFSSSQQVLWARDYEPWQSGGCANSKIDSDGFIEPVGLMIVTRDINVIAINSNRLLNHVFKAAHNARPRHYSFDISLHNSFNCTTQIIQCSWRNYKAVFCPTEELFSRDKNGVLYTIIVVKILRYKSQDGAVISYESAAIFSRFTNKLLA